jgi:7 transmembrane receptor (rhodopsin family)
VIGMSKSQIHRVDTRIAKTFGIIFGAFIICWTPVQVIYFIVAYTEDAHYFSHWLLSALHMFSIILTHFNSAINPFIYAFRIESINEVCKKLLGPIFQFRVEQSLETELKVINTKSASMSSLTNLRTNRVNKNNNVKVGHKMSEPNGSGL